MTENVTSRISKLMLYLHPAGADGTALSKKERKKLLGKEGAQEAAEEKVAVEFAPSKGSVSSEQKPKPAPAPVSVPEPDDDE